MSKTGENKLYKINQIFKIINEELPDSHENNCCINSDVFINKIYKVFGLKFKNIDVKRNKSAYIYFCIEQRPHLQETGKPSKDIVKILGQKWSVLTISDKIKYVEQAKLDKQRYEDCLKQLN